MKLIFEFEDAVVGIICGLLLIGFTGKFFSLNFGNIIYIIAFIVFSISIVLDLIFELSDLKTHLVFTIISIIHSVIDLVISLAIITYFTEWNVPFITSVLVPYLQNEVVIFWIGIFLVAGNAIWLLLYPFFNK